MQRRSFLSSLALSTAAGITLPPFRSGKLYPNDRPGLGVEVDWTQLKMIAGFTQRITNRAQTYFRPHGSITNW